MGKYSFQLQVFLLNRRFEQQQQIVWSGKGGVQDRTIYEDSVFARMLFNSGLLDERDYRCYCNLFNNMSNFMRKPNIIVHLRVTPEESLRRIKMRSRDCETSVTIEYLTALYDAYEEFIQNIARCVAALAALAAASPASRQSSWRARCSCAHPRMPGRRQGGACDQLLAHSLLLCSPAYARRPQGGACDKR